MARTSGPAEDGLRPEYDLEYPLSGWAPSTIVMDQDLLREFEYAPGNHWEAPYVTRIAGPGQAPLEGVLLTWRAPHG